MSERSDPLRAEMERWRREAENAHRIRVRCTEELEATKTQVLRLRAAGGSLAALVTDLMSAEDNDALRRLGDEALEAWNHAEAQSHADELPEDREDTEPPGAPG